MASVERSRDLRRKRARRSKLKKLREKYAKATSGGVKAEILAKARRVSPLIEEADMELAKK
jgi:hypothetical protein